MSDELKLAGESHRGAKAKALLDDDMLKEAFSVVENDIMEKWKACPIRDSEGQLALRLQWQCMTSIKKHLTDVILTGKMADEMIKQERTIRDRMKEAAKGAVRGFTR